MKSKVLFYFVAFASIISLQSCVTNYVASKPETYSKEYKTDAKLASLDAKIEKEKNLLINSFNSTKEIVVSNDVTKKLEIAKAIIAYKIALFA